MCQNISRPKSNQKYHHKNLKTKDIVLLGVISWIVIIYLDVVKSRIQADDPLNPKYKGMIDCFKQCYREGGFRIFGRGLVVMSLRAFPLNGATFLG